MLNENEKEFHSNRAWLSVIARGPRDVSLVNQITLDRLTKLGYTVIVTNQVMATAEGFAYLKYIKDNAEDYEI